MNIVNLFKLVRVLIIFGIFLAIMSIVLPFVTRIDPNTLSSAGQISSAIAAIFGLAIASLALFAYINREEVGQSQADRAWIEKERLENALHQFAVLAEGAYKIAGKGHPNESYYIKTFGAQALRNLSASIATARESDLYRVFSNIQTEDGQSCGAWLLMLEAEILRNESEEKINENLVFIIQSNAISLLIKALSTVTKDTVYKQIHKPLSDEVFKMMETMSQTLQRNHSDGNK